ncbi:hypothetical protein [Alteromonas stellipolaris]|uniref:Uncharacterized protein n=1 Tax=Alteromonas stellipolaris TaxID=233316 RepID=A0ABN4LMV5_9ALTE|nr:hypothetical protein [Alteromonas stellipolaris]AMJ75345.1 hypothetical protein AVL57_16050 [Alteromonas stellipolaris]
MFDYRNERYYRIFLVTFLIVNLSKNRTGKKVLSVEKLEILYFIINNPFLLKRISNVLNLGNVEGYQQDLYEKGYQFSDIRDRSEALIPFVFLKELNKVGLSQDGFIEIKELTNISTSSEYLNNNLPIFKKLASLTEAKLIKVVSENS